jgi:hypothetical protein
MPGAWDASGTIVIRPPRGSYHRSARQLKARFEREGLPIPALVAAPDYFERTYHTGADEADF